MNTVVTDPADIFQLIHGSASADIVAVPERTAWRHAVTYTTIGLVSAAGKLAAGGWKITRFDLVNAEQEPFEAAHDEAYRQILAHDLEAGGADKVAETLNTELTEVFIASVRAIKGYGQTDRYGRLFEDGSIHSDHIEDFATAIGATVELAAAA